MSIFGIFGVFYSIHILYDIANSVFVLLQFDDEKGSKKIIFTKCDLIFCIIKKDLTNLQFSI